MQERSLRGLKILITGDRNWTNWEVVADALSEFPRSALVIHGGAKGADTIAGKLAEQLGFSVHREPAQWEKYGRAAGPVRNKVMLDMEPDIVLAFHDDLENSKGTRHCVESAKKRGIEVRLFSTT
jgi:hypothetical protein